MYELNKYIVGYEDQQTKLADSENQPVSKSSPFGFLTDRAIMDFQQDLRRSPNRQEEDTQIVPRVRAVPKRTSGNEYQEHRKKRRTDGCLQESLSDDFQRLLSCGFRDGSGKPLDTGKIQEVQYIGRSSLVISGTCLKRYLEEWWAKLAQDQYRPRLPLSEECLEVSAKCFEELYMGRISDKIYLRLTQLILYLTVRHVRQKPDDYVSGSRKKGERIVTTILSQISGVHLETNAGKRFRRYAMSNYLRYGKRWAFLARVLGYGVLLISSDKLASHMYNPFPFSHRFNADHLTI